MGDLSLPNNPFAPPTPGLPDPPVIDPAVAAQLAQTHVPGDTAPPTFGDMAAIAAAIPVAVPAAGAPSGIPATGVLGGPPLPPAAPPLVQGIDPTLSFRQPVPGIGGAGGYGALPDNSKAIAAAGVADADAIKAEGAARAASDDAEAEARRQGAEQIAAQQKQLQDQRVQRDQFVRQLNQDSADALEKAHKTTVPDFWEGKEGLAVASAILVGLGAVGQGLTAFGTGVNIGNNAQTTINHAVDSYYERKKDEVANAYKYAAAKGQLNDQQKQEWATKLNDIQFDLVAAHQSIQDHLQEVAAQGRGKIDQAHYATLSAENQQKTQQLLQAARLNREQIIRMRAETNIGYMNANSERLKATTGKESADDQKNLQALQQREGKPAVELRQRLETLEGALKAAQDPNATGAERMKAFESAVAADSPGGKRAISMGQLAAIAPKLVSASGKWSDIAEQLLSGRSGQELSTSVAHLVKQSVENRRADYDANGQRLTSSLALLPYYKAHPDAVEAHVSQFYPKRAVETRTVTPKSGQYAGKTVEIDESGQVLRVVK